LSKKRIVAVLFGGRSAEHDVSVLSAGNVLRTIDTARYEVVPIRIERDGRWLLQVPLSDGAGVAEIEVAICPGNGRLVTAMPTESGHALPHIDVLFPVLHGPYGEDGAIQGLAETVGLPYVSCGILSSALCMDKDLTKRLLTAANIAVAHSVTLRRGETASFETIERRLGRPVFVKPARQGSSVGVGKADSAETFHAAVDLAFRHDDKLLVEEFVAGREIECAVLERPDGSLVVSDPGEIVTQGAHKFYTYEAKYLDADGAVVRTPADVSEHIRAESRALAERVFRVLDCSGMARIDFFLRADGSLLVNEVNTIPGFTDMSMYARALGAGGISYAEVVDTLIETALARHARAARLSAAA
jgi:D-alanine-D-alanine ligase